MSEFVVSARKYRPNKLEDVIGQTIITSTLQNAINNNQIAQSFLFCGPRGVGKTSCARIFAKEINNYSENEVKDFSFNIFELDAASNNSDQESTGVSFSYTMGGMTLGGAMNEVDSMDGVATGDYEGYEFNLSFAF